MSTDGSDDNISAAIAEYGEVPRTVKQGTIPIDFVAPPAEDEAVEDQALPEEASLPAGSPVVPEDAVSEETESDEAPAVVAAASATDELTTASGAKLGYMIAALVVIGALLALIAF